MVQASSVPATSGRSTQLPCSHVRLGSLPAGRGLRASGAPPARINVAPSQVAFSAENSTRAVDLLLSILKRCRDKPKALARDWSQGIRGAVDELVGRRGHAV